MPAGQPCAIVARGLSSGSLTRSAVDPYDRMQMRHVMRLTVLFTAMVLAAPALLSAQGLAAVAKKEEERRKNVKASGKVYTNTDLKPDITAPSATPGNASPAAPSADVPPAAATGGDGVPQGDGEIKDEKYWRTRITTARSALERSRIFGDALQSRINALTTDIVNRADPAQRSQLELERQRALAELDRVKKEIAEQTKAITDIEEEARKAGVPPGWLR